MPRWPSASVRLAVACLTLIATCPLAHPQARKEFVPSARGPARVSAAFLGSYRPDGKFKPDTDHLCVINEAGSSQKRPVEVPPWIDLHDHSEIIIENVAPPHHAVAPARPASRTKGAISAIAAFVYGHEAVLNRPSRLVVDSKQRLIVLDSDNAAVHVLEGTASFRIVGGPGHRLQHPDGIAVDLDDRIYISDGKAGIIQVYDRSGAFLRSLGTFHGEPIFQEPTAIAIDGQQHRMYVLDSPVNEMVILDLEGIVIERIGGWRHRGGVDFLFPSEIALRGSSVAVLDAAGSRLQIFDLDGKLAHVLQIGIMTNDARPRPMGLALDSVGNLYVSNEQPDVRVYNAEGKLRGVVPNCHRTASGLWVDGTNRIYIADPSASRVNVLQLPSAAVGGGPASR